MINCSSTALKIRNTLAIVNLLVKIPCFIELFTRYIKGVYNHVHIFSKPRQAYDHTLGLSYLLKGLLKLSPSSSDTSGLIIVLTLLSTYNKGFTLYV